MTADREALDLDALGLRAFEPGALASGRRAAAAVVRQAGQVE